MHRLQALNHRLLRQIISQAGVVTPGISHSIQARARIGDAGSQGAGMEQSVKNAASCGGRHQTMQIKTALGSEIFHHVATIQSDLHPAHLIEGRSAVLPTIFSSMPYPQDHDVIVQDEIADDIVAAEPIADFVRR